MKNINLKGFLLAAVCAVTALHTSAATSTGSGANEWEVLFDGTSLDGWKASEMPDVFSIIDGNTLKVEGGRSHLFWQGKGIRMANYQDFELRAKVKTTAGSNSGFFIHTEYQETGWPTHGYEAQINTSHKDKRKTGSIYALKDVEYDSPSIDDQWFDYLIRVEGKTVTVAVDGKVVNTYTEPDDLAPEERFKDRRFSSGTFAIQGHDPKSITYYQDIEVRVLD